MNDMPLPPNDIPLEMSSSTPLIAPKSAIKDKRSRAHMEMRIMPDGPAREDSRPTLKREREMERLLLTEGGGPPILPKLRGTGIPKLPRRRRSGNRMLVSFLLLVMLPVIAAGIYFGLLASNQYAAEFRFSVQNLSAPGLAASSANALVSAMGGASIGSPQNFVVVDYLKSRQAIDELKKRGVDVRAMYSQASIDWWSRFSSSASEEWFVRYWNKVVTADFDQYTGLATVEVRAFAPADAKLIADTLVTMSEELINRIAMRSNIDAVRFAEAEVVREQDALRKVKAKLQEFRNKAGVLDANAGVTAINAALAQSLQSSLAQLETNLATLSKQNLPSDSPIVRNLRSQISATKDQIKAIETRVGTSADGKTQSTLVGEYEQLDMERQYAQTMVTGAMQALDAARVTASSQGLYITPYVRPAMPDGSIYPRRWVSILLFTLADLTIWTILTLIVQATREHFTWVDDEEEAVI